LEDEYTENWSFHLHRNLRAVEHFDYPFASVLSVAKGLRAHAEIAQWPGYTPTPLLDFPGMAARAGVHRVLYKDEATRFGLGSFKALGDGWRG
jgi:diaminopropionate ammonia-lyase